MSSQAKWRRAGVPRGTGIAAAGTTALHTVAVAALLFGVRAGELPTPMVYEVSLVAAPRPSEDRPRPEAVERPAERPVQVNERTPRRTSVAPETPPEATLEDAETPVKTTSDVAPAPSAEPSTGDDPGTVETSGVEFPYPAYLNNIVAQIYRRWRRPEGNQALRAEILFFIRRDGSVTNLRFVRRSGNYIFDLEAQGAIEAAANSGAFGPLPDEFPGDLLPVSFFFDPETLR